VPLIEESEALDLGLNFAPTRRIDPVIDLLACVQAATGDKNFKEKFQKK